MHLALDGEVLGWNPQRGIPRVYQEVLRRLGGRADLDITVHTQGHVRERRLQEWGIEQKSVLCLPPNAWPWRLWRFLAPQVNRHLAARYWRGVKADVFHSTHYSLPGVHSPMFCVLHDMMAAEWMNGAVQCEQLTSVRFICGD